MKKLIYLEQLEGDIRNAQEDMNRTFQRLCQKHKAFNFDPDVMFTSVTKSDGTSKRNWELKITASLELYCQALEK